MINTNFNEKIVLALSFLILNNYFLLSMQVSQLIIKVNFLLFLLFILIFYFKNPLENFFLKISFLFILFISLGNPLIEWDPRSIWLFHGKRIFFDNSIFSVIDNYAAFSHNNYPSLVPAFSSSLAVVVGHWNEIFPKIGFSLIFLPPLILTFSFLKNTKYLIFLFIVFFVIGKQLFTGWADGLIAIYFCLSALLIYTILIIDSNFYKNKNHLYFISFCFFITLTLIKNEGVALLMILFFIVFLMKFFQKRLKRDIKPLIILSFSFIPIFLWKYYCYSNSIGQNDYINTNMLSILLPRLSELYNYQLISYFLFLNEKFLICLVFFSISFWINKDQKLFIYIFSIFITYVLILFIIFLSTPYDFYWQLNSTAARVVKSLSFLLAFFGLFNLRNWKMLN